jgi:outer membrane protein TolC
METAQSRELTARSQLSVVSAKGLQTEAYADLTAAMGVSPLATIQIAPEERRPLSAEELAPVEQLVHDALARRPDVLGAYTAVQASQAALRAAKAQNRPKIFLAGTGAYVSGELGLSAIPPVGEQLPTLNISGNHWNGTVLVGVSIPIFDAHQHANAVRQAKNNEDRANASLNQVRLNAIREIVIAQNALRTSLAAHDAAGVLKLSAQTSYDAALTSYKEGVGTVTDAVEAETELFQAELADDNAYTSALSAAATLAFATGILGAAPR